MCNSKKKGWYPTREPLAGNMFVQKPFLLLWFRTKAQCPIVESHHPSKAEAAGLIILNNNYVFLYTCDISVEYIPKGASNKSIGIRFVTKVNGASPNRKRKTMARKEEVELRSLNNRLKLLEPIVVVDLPSNWRDMMGDLDAGQATAPT
jgi:hypothetical protein